MSKEIISVHRTVVEKEWLCPVCRGSVDGDKYYLEHKDRDGSIFALVMCVDCLRERFFKK